MTQRILQWNLRGIRARTQDLRLLLHETNPSFICLQELKLPDSEANFAIHHSYHTHIRLPEENAVPKGGVLVAVRKTIPHSAVQLNTPLQAVAVHLHEGPLRSISSIYLPPGDNITINQIQQLIDQLPKPTLLSGDFNAHNPMWYSPSLDPRGTVIESVIELGDLVPINEDMPTYFRSYDQTASHIDLTLVSSLLAPDYTWTTLDELHGSDH